MRIHPILSVQEFLLETQTQRGRSNLAELLLSFFAYFYAHHLCPFPRPTSCVHQLRPPPAPTTYANHLLQLPPRQETNTLQISFFVKCAAVGLSGPSQRKEEHHLARLPHPPRMAIPRHFRLPTKKQARQNFPLPPPPCTPQKSQILAPLCFRSFPPYRY